MSTKQFLLSLFCVLFLFQLEQPIAIGKKASWCIDEEREALLSFKESLVDDSGILSSWGREDDKRNCCNWFRVTCSNITGHVTELSLSYAELAGPIPSHLGNLSRLQHLDLVGNKLEGGIPKFFGNMCSLNNLLLSSNKLSGQLSEFIQNMSGGCMKNSLRLLYLDDNNITGTIPDLEGFSSLTTLSLSENSLTGVVSEAVFSNLSNLLALELADNSLALNFSLDWVPPFQLQYIHLGSCKMGPHFPKWLQTQKNIAELDISSAGIVGTVPDWLWDLNNTTSFLNMSNNQIEGSLPDLSFMFDYLILDISSNHFEGPIPPLPLNSSFLNLSKNKFSGLISVLCSKTVYDFLTYLDLSDNSLSGRLPDCWFLFEKLATLNLAKNNFFGIIPKSMRFLSNIQSLNLYNNNLTGKLPSFFPNGSQLMTFMDLGNNKLSGEIPPWIGESLPNLVVLKLKSNKFYGSIPFQLCHLTRIQILDLSLNNFSGTIPKCFHNFTAMTKEEHSGSSTISQDLPLQYWSSLPIPSYFEKTTLTWKGVQYEYKSILGLVKILDLSGNQLGGEVPAEIMDLVGLVGLNLSRNNLTGQISPKIGELKSLDFLDLSRNHFFGAIPSGLSQLSGLSVMNLSHNNLSGKIPTGTQLQSYNASAYVGNPELCGLPLPRKCPDEQSAPGSGTDNDAIITPEDDGDDDFMTLGFYLSLILGFFFGFWGVCGTLLVKRSWRRNYYKLLTDMKDWVYVRAMLNIGILQRKFKILING